MADTLKSVVDIVDERGPIDNRVTFDTLWSIISGLKDRLADRFELTVDDGYADIASYASAPGAAADAQGEFTGYSGPEIDWLVHSWMGNPEGGFTNMHLTCWLGPHVKVPHLTYAWGTLPDLWFLIDYQPRSDLALDLDSLDTFFGPSNEQFLELKADPGLSYFTSRTLHVRQSVSHTGLCFVSAENTPERIEQIGVLANQRMDEWLGFLDSAPPVPVAERAELADRDLHVRRSIAERDPANALGVRFYGEQLTARLVEALWGADRSTERPTGPSDD